MRVESQGDRRRARQEWTLVSTFVAALLGAVLGAFAGGIGTYVAMRGAAVLQVRREIRQSLLLEQLPVLRSDHGDHFAAGSYHGDLVAALSNVRRKTYLLSKAEDRLAADLAQAWLAALPTPRDPVYNPDRQLSVPQQTAIDVAHVALTRRLRAKLRPLRDRVPGRTAHWPSRVAG